MNAQAAVGGPAEGTVHEAGEKDDGFAVDSDVCMYVCTFLFVLSGFYIFAGINHFLNPEFYLPLIPDYFSNAEFINVLAGLAEIILGIGLLIKKVRRVAIIGVVLMLLAFIPSHVYFIQKGSCIDGGLGQRASSGQFRNGR